MVDKEVAKMSEKHADIVIGRKFSPYVDSPLFLDKLSDDFFNGLEEAGHSPSKQRQREIEHFIGNVVESFSEALQRFDLDLEASVSLVKSGIEEIGNNNPEGE